MPLRPLGQPSAPAAPRRGGLRPLTPPTSDVVPETPTAEGDDASSWGLPAAVTAGAVGAGALAMRNPQAAVKLAKTAARHVNDVRIGSMLSGLALPKSMLGNLGAATYAGIERGSLAPLKSLLSMQTVRDAAKSFKAGSGSANLGAPATAIARYNPITRAMGALDDATQAALVRSGVMHDADEVQGMLAKGVPLPTAMRTSASRAAARETLQAPLDPGMQKAMSGPVAQYMVPFRRTPFNQFTEGLQTLNPETKGQVAALATSLTTGGATGYTADDPKTIALGAAASGRYGLPFTMSAAVGRYLKTGNMRKAADAMQGVSPVSDYSLQGAVLEPMKVIPKPAAVGAYDYVKKLLGM